MTDHLRVLAVDDEPLALADVAELLRDHPDVGEVLTAESSADALKALSTAQIDAVFLDVRMPEFDGIELARVLRRFSRPPALVFVSAYESAVVDAFDLDAADYLMKPMTSRRISDALRKIRQAGGTGETDRGMPSVQPQVDAGADVIAVYPARGGGVRLLSRDMVLYFEAYGDYQRVFSTEGRYLIRARLSDLEHRWAVHGFLRIHRKFIVNIKRAVSILQRSTGVWVVTLSDGSEVPIARRHLRELRHRLSP